MKKIIQLLLVFSSVVFIVNECPAQIAMDSLKVIVETETQKQVAKQLVYPKIFLGVSVAGLSFLGVFLWFWKIKKIAENVVKEKTQNLVELQIAEKIGVKMETLRQYFQEIEKREAAIRQKRILVVNKEAGKRLDLEKLIQNAGFAADTEELLLFKKLSEVALANDQGKNTEYIIDTNKHDLLLIDNFDSRCTEKEIEGLIEKYKGALKLVCFTKSDFENYKIFSQYAKIVKMEERLGQALVDALKQ